MKWVRMGIRRKTYFESMLYYHIGIATIKNKNHKFLKYLLKFTIINKLKIRRDNLESSFVKLV